MSRPKTPKIQRRLEQRMDFIFSDRLYDDLLTALEEIRSEQKQEANVNTPVSSTK
jgi:hypothetical protein